MKAKEIIRKIMESKEVRPSELASRIGVSRATLNNRINQDNISIDKLIDVLRVMDYKIIIVPRSAKLPKDSFEVE